MGHRLAATEIAVAFAIFALFSSAAAQSIGGLIDPLAPRTFEVTSDARSSADPLAPVDAPPESPSQAVIELSNWILATVDAQDLPFIVIDKLAAEVFLFDRKGQLVAKTPALLGVTPGDDSAPGVGDRELSQIPVEDRTTPAGRFFAKFGPAPGNKQVLWVDYATAVSLHPVVRGTKKERRLQRLKSLSSEDNRITFGCINVEPIFYTGILHDLFEDKGGVVYILPEEKPLTEVFLAYQPQGQTVRGRR